MKHDANLARVQALRDADSRGIPPLPPFLWAPVLDHVEDVLTRHAPIDEGTLVPEVYCDESSHPWPCPDYTSALTLLDTLDGGA